MTSPHDEPDLPPLDPAEETRVRRLLAAARETGPMPPEVVARMERTLADLERQRASAGVAHVSRHRRRNAAVMLGAAAAVVAVAVGAGQLVRDPVDDGGAPSSTTAESGVERGQADAAEPERADAPADADQGSAGAVEDNLTAERSRTTDEPPREVRPRRLVADLTALQDTALPHPATADYGRTQVTAPTDFPCASAPWGRGVVVGVLYDGMPAMVAFREPMGESQVAEVLQCGTGDVLRSTTLPAG